MKKIVLLLIAGCIWLTTQAQSPSHVPGDILVKVSGAQSIKRIVNDLSALGQKPSQLRAIRQLSVNAGIWLLHFDPKNISEAEMLRSVKAHRDVLEAQYNHYLEQRATTPADADFGQQWQWVNDGTGGGTPDADVDAELAWDITTGGLTPLGDTIVVCVVDDGTTLNHPDLKQNIWVNHGEIPDDGIDNEGNGYIDDYYGWNINSEDDNVGDGNHGTSVSGMIGASGNNGIGVTGINWNVKIMSVRYGSLIESNVIESYDYPLTMRKMYNSSNGTKGAYVVATNSSWGIDNAKSSDFPLWCSFYDTLGVHGILSCASTTNNNANVDIVGDMPTTCTSDYLISVGRTTNKDAVEGGTGVAHVDLGAPGSNIYTTSKNSYKFTTGTSFSSPLVAGIIALMYSAPCTDIISLSKTFPGAAALLMKKYLLDGVDKKSGMQDKYLSGGRANAYNSITELLKQCSSCLPPLNINSIVISGTEANITWSLPDSVSEVKLNYKGPGSTWKTIDHLNGTNYIIQNLQPCTVYEFQLASYCNETLSTYSNTLSFKTLGCCEGPFGLSVTKTDTTANISWDAVFGSDAYILFYKKETDTDFSKIQTKSSPQTISGLEPCTLYQIFVSTQCANGITTNSDTISFKTDGCGACESLAYCVAFGSEYQEEWISNVSLNGTSNTSENDGYKFFTETSFNIEKNKPSTISITPSYAGAFYSEHFRVWIDYNQDGSFDDVSELVFDPVDTNTTVTGSFVVPSNAVAGHTRMRVAMSFAGFGGDKPEACGEIVFGEVEDYCVFIKDTVVTPQSCDAPTGLEVPELGKTNVKLNWNKVALAGKYTLEYKLASDTIWEQLPNILEPPIAIGGLIADTTYVWRVQSNCDVDNSSFSVVDTFTTAKPDATTYIGADRIFSLFPNPVQGQVSIFFREAGLSNISISVRTVNGTELLHTQNESVTAAEIRLDISHLVAGMYFITIQSDQGTYVQKLIKQ